MCRGVEHRECLALFQIRDKYGASVRCVEEYRNRGGVCVMHPNAETQEPAQVNDFGEKAPVTYWALVARVAWRELGEGREYGRVAEVGRVCCLL